MGEMGVRQGGGGRFAGSVAGTPFALSRGRAVFRHSQNGRHPHQFALPRLEGVRRARIFSVLFSFCSPRSFAVRSSFVTAPPLGGQCSGLFQPSTAVPTAAAFPSTVRFPPPFLRLSPLPARLTQRHWRQPETGLSRFTLLLTPFHTSLPIFSFQPFGHPLSLSPFFTASVFRLFHPRHRFHPSSALPVQRHLHDFLSRSLCSGHPLRSSPIPLSLFPPSRPRTPPPVGLARIYTSARCSRRGRARILLRRTRMKFITNYGKSLDDRRAVRRPETHGGGPR